MSAPPRETTGGTTRAPRGGPSRVIVVVAGLAALMAAVLPSCRLVTREVACVRDRDCPDAPDGGIPYCTRWSDWDAGVGVCTDDPDFAGDVRDTDDDTDAGMTPPADGGPSDDGGA